MTWRPGRRDGRWPTATCSGSRRSPGTGCWCTARSRPGQADSGRRRAGRSFLYGDYHDCELGYAVTDHVAQSRTVDAGLALISGLEDRQHAYVAMTRGRESNTAFVLHPVTEDR